MLRHCAPWLVGMASIFICTSSCAAETAEPAWLSDYGEAYALAKKEQKMLLIYFRAPQSEPGAAAFEETTCQDEQVKQLLKQFILLRLPTTAQIRVDEDEVSLLSHAAFQRMHTQAGLAIVDLKHPGQPYYGDVVSCLPFEKPAYYAPAYWGPKSVRTLLQLPAGTITQRTLVYAVRLHPETPASTSGAAHPALFQAAAQHSQHQATIRLLGHHNWNTRFHQISRQVGASSAAEVCAQSWRGERLLPACLSCVHSWRQSPGHWSSVSRKQPAYGYDIRRGEDGVWYATGIFSGG